MMIDASRSMSGSPRVHSSMVPYSVSAGASYFSKVPSDLLAWTFTLGS